jgi:hypothetical protein
VRPRCGAPAPVVARRPVGSALTDAPTRPAEEQLRPVRHLIQGDNTMRASKQSRQPRNGSLASASDRVQVKSVARRPGESDVTVPALSGVRVPGAPPGYEATLETVIDGHTATYHVSRLDGEDDWFCDGLVMNGKVRWSTGYGTRDARSARLDDSALRRALDAICDLIGGRPRAPQSVRGRSQPDGARRTGAVAVPARAPTRSSAPPGIPSRGGGEASSPGTGDHLT